MVARPIAPEEQLRWALWRELLLTTAQGPVASARENTVGLASSHGSSYVAECKHRQSGSRQRLLATRHTGCAHLITPADMSLDLPSA